VLGAALSVESWARIGGEVPAQLWAQRQQHSKSITVIRRLRCSAYRVANIKPEPLFEIRDSPERAGCRPSKSHAPNQELYVSEPVTGARGPLPLSSARSQALNPGHQPPAKCRQQLHSCWLTPLTLTDLRTSTM
jgi:hypothetical protein